VVVLFVVFYLKQRSANKNSVFANAILNNGNSLIIATDKFGNVSFCSNNVQKILGYKQQQVMGDSFWKLTEDKDFDPADYAAKYDETKTYVRKLKCSSGKHKFIQWTDKKHNDNLYVGIGQDVTEQINLQEQYKNLVQNATDVIYESDAFGNFIFFNDMLKEMFGYEKEELLGQHFSVVIKDSYKESVSSFYTQLATDKNNFDTIEFPICCKDKKEIWVSQKVSVTRNEKGSIARYSAIVRDITAIKNIEIKSTFRNQKRNNYNFVLAGLTTNPNVLNLSFDENLRNILHSASKCLKLNRISVWDYFDDKIVCTKSYNVNQNVFASNGVFYRKDVPIYFKGLSKGITIVANNIDENDHTSEFNKIQGNEIKSLLDVPIFINGILVGLLCCEMTTEYTVWDNEDVNFARSLAEIISVSIETQKRLIAEKNIQESETNFRLINDTIDDVFWLYDLNLAKIISISPSAQKVFGVSVNNFYNIQNYWETIVLDEDKNIIREAHKLIFTKGNYEIEYRINTNDTVKWIHEKSFGIKDEAGNYVKSSGICSDISQQKLTQIQLKQLSIVAEKTSNGVLIADEEGKAIWANQGYLDMCEITFDELLGKRPRDLFNVNNPEHDAEINVLSGSNFTKEFEIFTHKNKKSKWVELNNTTILDDKGNVVQQIEILSDITEKVNARKTLLQYSTDLEYQINLQKKIISAKNYDELALETLSFIKQQTKSCCKISLYSIDAKYTTYNGHYLVNNQLTKTRLIAAETTSFNTVQKGEIYIEKNLHQIENKSVSDIEDYHEGVVSYIVLPIKNYSKLIGTLNISLDCEFNLQENEVKNLETFTVLLSVALQQINLQNEIISKNKDTTDSLNYAKNIQNTILPELKNMSKTFNEINMYFKPRDIVSGDFYWAREYNNFTFFAVADCTGHGVPGAFLTLIGSRILEQIIEVEKLTNSAEILTRLDDQIYDSLNSKQKDIIRDGMEIALCVVDKVNRKIQFSGAGLGLLYFLNGEEFYIKGQRKSIGDYRYDDFVFETIEIDYTGNEIFYMATDGYQDQLGGVNYKRFSKKRTIELLRNIANVQTNQREQLLDDEIKSFIGNYPQTDDITVAAFRLN